MLTYIKIILRGVGQVMLQNNSLTGLLFLTGIFYNSWIMGLGAIIGNISGTIFSTFLKYPKEDIKNGLYGFNGTLVGIALCYFLGLSIITTLTIILGAFISTVIMHEIKKKVPAFTAPFVIATWIVVFGVKFINLDTLIASPSLQTNTLNLIPAIFKGLGQVMFQENIVTGLIFLLAILVNSRTAAIYALYGTLLGALFAMFLSVPITTINLGICGYNAVLCGIALGDKKWPAFFLASFAIILSVLLNLGLNKIGAITLTAPFVLATWVALFISYSRNKLWS